jgi:hypothetical protein
MGTLELKYEPLGKISLRFHLFIHVNLADFHGQFPNIAHVQIFFPAC